MARSAASHLLALAALAQVVVQPPPGPPQLLVDNIGLDSVGGIGGGPWEPPNSITNRTITVTSENSNDVILNIQLLTWKMVQPLAEWGLMEPWGLFL